jgi:cytochrome c-type protein NapC
MPSPTTLLYLLIGISILHIAFLVARPSLTVSPGGKAMAFVVLFLLPVVVASMGAAEHMQRSEQTQFCLSCHAMAPFGRSLHYQDLSYIPAAHYENSRVPRNQACYTCHTDYVMYGTILSKIRGLRHVYVQYFGTVPQPGQIHLYTPYNNRECLHCHAGARSFVEQPVHTAIMQQITTNQFSCLSSGCHSSVHDPAHADAKKLWKEPLP